MKVAAIFDKPTCCEDCPCSYETEGCYTNYCRLAVANGRLVGDCELDLYGDDITIPDWCPLVEVKDEYRTSNL